MAIILQKKPPTPFEADGKSTTNKQLINSVFLLRCTYYGEYS